MATSSLQTLLGLASPSNRTLGGPSQPAYTPRIGRNQARAGALHKFFGLPGEAAGDISQEDYESAYDIAVQDQLRQLAAKAEAESLPERVRGEYGLRQTGMQGATARDVARINREAAALERESGREFTASQNELNRAAAFGRASMSQAGQSARSAAGQAGITARQRAGQAEGRARMLETGKVEPTYAKPSGALESVQSFLGLGKFGRARAAREEAARLRSEALAGIETEPDALETVAAYYRASGLSGSRLLEQIQRDQPDATPEEIQALLQLLSQ